jgi:hypothetical protein
VAAAATFSAVVFSDEAKATVSSHVGGRVTTGAADGCPGNCCPDACCPGACCPDAWPDFAGIEISCAEVGAADVRDAAGGLAAAACRSSSLISSGPGGVGASMKAGSGSGGRPINESKNLRGPLRGLGGADHEGDSQPCVTARASPMRQVRSQRRRRQACRNSCAFMG